MGVHVAFAAEDVHPFDVDPERHPEGEQSGARVSKRDGDTPRQGLRLDEGDLDTPSDGYDIARALEREDEIEVERYEPQPA